MNFNQIYQQLNPNQRLAVDTIEGPVMVIAGPGTGKTQVLAARIANILHKTDTNPSSILALTFTEVAATNMRQRLFEMIGSTAYQVRIMTFHGFCNDVILSHPEFFNLREESEPISDLEFVEFLRSYFSNPQLEFLRTPNSAFHYLLAAKSALLNIKKEGISVTQFEKMVKQEEKELEKDKEDLSPTKLKLAESRLGKMRELSDLYKAYQDYLSNNSRYDYEDMILWVLSEFEKNKTLLSEYQEQLHYFLVDEYQDTNSAQNKILDLLASFWSESANVFVVGDPNQTIYRFQGASLENVLGFVKRYANLQIVSLTQGYRCSQQIYQSAAQTIANQKIKPNQAHELLSVLSQPLESLFQAEPIVLMEAQTRAIEEVSLLNKIDELIKKGVEPNQIAVLFKKNKQALDFIPLLRKWNIEYQLERNEDILQSEFIRQILVLMRVVSDLQKSPESINLAHLLLFEWVDVDKLTVLKLLHLASLQKIPLYSYLFLVSETELREQKIEFENFEKIKCFVKIVEDLLFKQATLTFLEWFPELIRQVKLESWLLNHKQKYQWLQELNAFYSQIKSLSLTDKNLNLDRFLQIIEAMVDQGLAIPIKILLGSKEGVVLSTAHGSKGKEWKYVFIPQLADKIWGNTRAPLQVPLPSSILRFQSETIDDKNADDRRLFYVSLTRAKKQVFLSFAQTDEVKDKKQNLSLFAGELLEVEGLIEKKQSVIKDDEIEGQTAQYVLPDKILPTDDHFRSWLGQLVTDFKLSPTALDSYLKDPQNFLFNNILRVPRAKTASLVFGTAIHSTLEYTIRWWQKNHILMPVEKIHQYYQQVLEKEVLTQEDFISRLKSGQRVLSEYFAHFDEQIQPIKLEYTFGSAGRDVMLDDIKLTGKLDRIDFVDRVKNIIKVVDYKTGKVKSPNQIEGKTYQTSLSDREKMLPDPIKGALKRQLLFYKLLSKLDPNFRYKVEYGELDFVEGFAQNGKSGKVLFELKDEDVELLSQLIKQVMAEIRQLKFLEIKNSK